MWSVWDHQGGVCSLPMFLRELFLRELGRDSKVTFPLTFGIPRGQIPSQGPHSFLPQFEPLHSQE